MPSSWDETSEAALRAEICAQLRDHDAPALRAFADAIETVHDGHLACWGTLAGFVRDNVRDDEDRVALWRVLVAVGERRPLLVLLDLCRTQPTVLAAMADDIGRVQPLIQCAFVSMPEAEAFWERALPHLGPAAREMLERGPEAVLRERAVYAAHMGALRAHQMGARVT